MEHSGVVESFTPKSTSKGTVYELRIGGMDFSTWKQEVAELAKLGEAVTVQYDQQTRGRFTNNVLLDVVPGGQTPGAQNPLPPQATRDNASGTAQSPGEIPVDRESRIIRQSAMKTAFGFAGSVYQGSPEHWDEAVERALILAADIYKLAWKGNGS